MYFLNKNVWNFDSADNILMLIFNNEINNTKYTKQHPQQMIDIDKFIKNININLVHIILH